MSILFTHLTPKLLELISELVPQAKSIALLVNPNGPITKSMIQETEEAARTKGLQLPVLKARTDTEIDAAFAALTDLRADAVIVSTDPFFGTRSEQIVARAARVKIPAVYFSAGATALGGLISYGTNLPAVYRPDGHLCRQNPEGRKARRPAGRTAHQVRDGDQPENRQNSRPHRAADAACHRRRGDRMSWRRI